MKALKKWGITLLLAGSLLATNVNAASFTLTATPSKTTVEPGDTVTVDIAVSNIDIANGINTVEGMLEYDENVLEAITADSFAAKSNWTTNYNGEQTSSLYGKFLIVTLSQGEVSDQSIATLTLKVKETATRGTSTQIKLKNLSTNDGDNLVNETDKTITLNIAKAEVPAPVTNTAPPVNEVENLSPKPIPQTGEKLIIPGIVTVLGAIGIFAYVKFHNYRKL